MNLRNDTASQRALYVSAFIPDSVAEHAGGQAAHANLSSLRQLGYEIRTLVCTTEKSSHPGLPEEAVYRQSRSGLLLGWTRSVLRRRLHGFVSWPILDTRANSDFERRLCHEIAEFRPDIIFADFTQMLLPVYRATSMLASPPQIRVCVHDIFLQRLLRDPGWLAKALLGPVVLAERRLLLWVDQVITLSAKDEVLVRTLYDCHSIRVQQFSAPLWIGYVHRLTENIAPREVLFFANFQRPENQEALDWFGKHALPELLKEFSDFRLVLAGTGSDVVKIPNDGAHVSRLGFMQNPAPAFSHCRLAIAPLSQGAGVKFKVLEALACCVPVLGTAVALEGVDRSDLVHEATRLEFAKKLGGLLR